MEIRQDVAVLVGSLRRDPINRKIARALAGRAPPELAPGIVEIGALPLHGQDRDGAPPAEWITFRDRIPANHHLRHSLMTAFAAWIETVAPARRCSS